MIVWIQAKAPSWAELDEDPRFFLYDHETLADLVWAKRAGSRTKGARQDDLTVPEE